MNPDTISQTGYRLRETWLVWIEVTAYWRLSDQSGSMAKQLTQRDGRFAFKRVDGGKIGKVFLDRRVEVHLFLLHELHDPHGGKKFGNGSHPVNRVGPG